MHKMTFDSQIYDMKFNTCNIYDKYHTINIILDVIN